MTSLQQRAELHRQIWAIANDVRGSVDGWDFKHYVLGALFYRFISEHNLLSGFIGANSQARLVHLLLFVDIRSKSARITAAVWSVI